MKNIICAIVFMFLLSIPALAQQSYNVTVSWEHDGAVEFRLYQENEQITVFPGDVREGNTIIHMVEFQHTYTMTAVDGWGRESNHSVPLEYAAPLLDAPRGLHFNLIN